jgi:hypothetical protein
MSENLTLIVGLAVTLGINTYSNVFVLKMRLALLSSLRGFVTLLNDVTCGGMF